MYLFFARSISYKLTWLILIIGRHVSADLTGNGNSWDGRSPQMWAGTGSKATPHLQPCLSPGDVPVPLSSVFLRAGQLFINHTISIAEVGHWKMDCGRMMPTLISFLSLLPFAEMLMGEFELVNWHCRSKWELKYVSSEWTVAVVFSVFMLVAGNRADMDQLPGFVYVFYL